MARPKQQRIDPKSVDRAVAAARKSKEHRPQPVRTTERAVAEERSAKNSRPVPPKAKTKAARPGKNEVKPATARDWIAGARPQTLALAISPVALGTACATVLMAEPYTHWARAVLCLIVAMALQIGVNFANDYSDGIRGTDDHRRQGPRRLVGSGAAKPRTVLTVALVFFGIAAVAGLVLVVRSGQWWLLAVGAVAIAAAWFYTGGKRPYGYAGLGEVGVFVFFGLVATVGTMVVQVGEISLDAWLAGVAAGLFACAVLMSNNLRDRERDAQSGKRTLAVRIGSLPSRILYIVMMLVPFGLLPYFMLLYFNVGYVFFALLAAVPAMVIAATAKTTPEFLVVLRLTVVTSLLYGLGLAAAITF